MKKITFLTIYAIISASALFGQCSSQFSFAATSETIIFSNQSNVSNAHYFWNFGDGTGSNSTNPIYEFPETGKYLVTLFALDTVSNCSSYYEQWISVTKSSTNTCQPGFKDSVLFTNMYSTVYLQLTDTSLNCNNSTKFVDGGYSQNIPGYMWAFLDVYPGRYVGRMKYVTTGQNTRAAYKTVPFRYNSAKNYNGCSANFEFKVVSQNASGQRILFSAMNKSATAYEWLIMAGMTSSTNPTTDTVSVYYPYSLYSNSIFLAVLRTTGSTGCNDTLFQNIRIPDMGLTSVGLEEYSSATFSLDIFPNPAQDKIIIKSTIGVERLSLANALGQQIFVLDKPKPMQEIDISSLSSGIYFLKAENSRSQGVVKVVKE